MCRVIAYIGEDVLIEDVLVKPANSLVQQSLHARETDMPTNGDGFGLGWYVPSISSEPALFRSIQPAWNDSNLLHLAAKIKAPCFFSHVRAASAGGVSHFNCHPFIHQNFMFMHNGGIYNFTKVERHLRHLLEDDIYEQVKGQTDSEHAFALFLQLGKHKDLTDIEQIALTLQETIQTIEQLVADFSTPGDSNLNFVLTDGKKIVASHYHTSANSPGRTLHYAVGDAFIEKDGRYHVTPSKGVPRCALVASERLNDFNTEWIDVPQNHLLLMDFTNKDNPIIVTQPIV